MFPSLLRNILMYINTCWLAFSFLSYFIISLYLFSSFLTGKWGELTKCWKYGFPDLII